MYGLMRAGICSRNHERAYQRRLHYCGACKTMGRLYGQQSRLLLNNDAVFLGELLSALGPNGAPVSDWDRSYQSFNCLSLPAGEEEMPLALQVAATATLVMSEFKVADQLDDGGSGKWKLAQRIYSQSFCDASRRMKDWGFPLAEMWQRYQTQRPREEEAMRTSGTRGVIQTLEYVAEPTAAVTGWTFQNGAAVVGAAGATQQTMYALGSAFGRLVYVLDALDDYEQDLKRGDFNALQAAFQLPGAPTAPFERPVSGRKLVSGEQPVSGTQAASQDRIASGAGGRSGGQTVSGERSIAALPESSRATTEAYLRELAAAVASAIDALPLPAELADLFTTRLNSNLDRRINPSSACSTSSRGLLQRLAQMVRRALRIPALQQAHALPGGSAPVHLTENRSLTTSTGGGKGVVTRRVRRGGGSGCGGCCEGCECCACACCEGCQCCECCGEGACSGCGECCGSCGSGCAL